VAARVEELGIEKVEGQGIGASVVLTSFFWVDGRVFVIGSPFGI